VYCKYESRPAVSPGAAPSSLYKSSVPLGLNSRIRESRSPDVRSRSKPIFCPATTVKLYTSTSLGSERGSGIEPVVLIVPLTELPGDVEVASKNWSLGSSEVASTVTSISSRYQPSRLIFMSEEYTNDSVWIPPRKPLRLMV